MPPEGARAFRDVPLRVCFVGDSYVAGTGDPDCLGWVGRLGKRAAAKGFLPTLYNLGVRGETSRDVARRWRVECADRLPPTGAMAIVLSFGLNDIAEELGVGLRCPPEESLANARAVLAGAASLARTLWVGPPPANEAGSPMSPLPGITYDFSAERLLALNADFARLATELDVPFLDIATPLSRDEAYLGSFAEGDGLHCGHAGYERIASLIWSWEPWAGLLRDTVSGSP